MLAPRTDTNLHQEVQVARLLALGGLVADAAAGHAAIARGQVKIEQWTIGVSHASLPRWILRGVSISKGDRSIEISDDGCRIVRQREVTLA